MTVWILLILSLSDGRTRTIEFKDKEWCKMAEDKINSNRSTGSVYKAFCLGDIDPTAK